MELVRDRALKVDGEKTQSSFNTLTNDTLNSFRCCSLHLDPFRAVDRWSSVIFSSWKLSATSRELSQLFVVTESTENRTHVTLVFQLKSAQLWFCGLSSFDRYEKYGPNSERLIKSRPMTPAQIFWDDDDVQRGITRNYDENRNWFEAHIPNR